MQHAGKKKKKVEKNSGWTGLQDVGGSNLPEVGLDRWDKRTQQDVGLGDAFQSSGINLILLALLCPQSLDLLDRKEIWHSGASTCLKQPLNLTASLRNDALSYPSSSIPTAGICKRLCAELIMRN